MLTLLLSLFWIEPSRAWTYYFFISGDRDYGGPTWGANAKLEDQSARLYAEVQTLAISDKINRYVIYYDPRGGVGFWWFSSAFSRLEVYSRGRQLLDKRWSETDSTDPKQFQRLIQLAEDKILTRDSVHRFEDPTMFYYYGEHIPSWVQNMAPQTSLDESHPKQIFTTSTLHTMLNDFATRVHYPKLVVMHSCSMGSVELLRSIPHVDAYPTAILAPIETISNSALKLDVLKDSKASPVTLAKQIQADQDNTRYKHALNLWVTDRTFTRRLRAIAKIEATIRTRFQREWSRDLSDWTKLRTIESLESPLTDEAGSHELLVTLPDYLQLLDRYVDKTKSDEIQAFIEDLQKDSAWSTLKKTLMPL